MRKLASIGREPGRNENHQLRCTQSRKLEQWRRTAEWYLVDLPGYGLRKTKPTNRDSWSGFIDEYIKIRRISRMVGASYWI